MIKCQSGRLAQSVKKWLRSPHNRFKSAKSHPIGSSRSQRESSARPSSSALIVTQVHNKYTPSQARKLKLHFGLIFILMNLLMLAASTSGRAEAPSALAGNQSPRRPEGRLDTEDEVELLRPAQRPHEQVHQAASQAHIYRIRAAPMNGRLALPEGSSIKRIQIGDAVAGAHRRLPLTERRPGEPSTTTTTTTATTSPADTTAANFGTRAGTPPTPGPTRTRQQQARNQSHQEHCKQPGEELEQAAGSSISASSPMLRLTGSNRTITQLVGSRPEALSASLRSRFREIEELSSPSESEPNTEASRADRTRPTLIGARAPAGSGPSQVGAPHAGRLGAGGSIAETSMASGEEVDAESPRRTSGASAADSILSLIDDYDSKIITNRTKGKFCRLGVVLARPNEAGAVGSAS